MTTGDNTMTETFNPNHLADQIEERDGRTLLHFRGEFIERPGCLQIVNTSKGLGPFSVARWEVLRVVEPFANGWTVLEVRGR